MRRAQREALSGYVLLFPTIITILLIVGFPLGYLIYFSFSNFYYASVTGFAGFSNYINVLTDSNFAASLKATGYFTVSTVAAQLILGLGIALLINSAGRMEKNIRVLAILPYMISMVAAGVSFRWMFHTEYGLFNYLLRNIGIIEGNINFLGEPTSAMASIVITHVWSQTPFSVLILLAGLKQIPKELYETAKIDGAGSIKRFLYITLPLIKPQILVVLLIRTMFAIRHFPLPYTMTGGGPGVTTKVLSLVLQEKLTHLVFGYQSALSIIMMIMTMLIAGFYMMLLYRDNQ